MIKLPTLLRERLAPLKNRHFRHLWTVQGVSLVGTWMQELAKSWIVINMVGTAGAIGSLMFAAALPNIALASFGGSYADRKGARKTLIVTQVLLACLAFCLGLLVSGGHIRFWQLIVFAILEGSVIAFDMPAFNLVTPQLVPRDQFQQAMALNTVNFHLSRVLGPSLAGLIMGIWGPQAVFWINAISFAGVVVIIARLPLEDFSTMGKKIKAPMGEVVKFLWGHPVFARIIAQFMLLMAIVFPLIFTTLRVFLQNKFHLSAKQFGFVFAAPGVGALVGSLGFLLFSPKNPLKLLPYGVAGLTCMLIAIAEVNYLAPAVVVITFFSMFTSMTLSALLVTIQLQVEDRMRGRVSALIGIGFAAISPVMAVPIGLLSDYLGPRVLLWTVALVFGISSALLSVLWKKKPAIAT